MRTILKNRTTIFIIASISLIFSIFTINDTYGKYQSSAVGQADFGIARWKIKINNQSILSNTSITNTITPTLSGNDNVEDGYIAPTSEGYFDIVIDTSAVDVSYSYNVSTTVAQDSSVKDLIVTGYSINGGSKVSITNDNPDISNTVLQSSKVDTINLRIYIKWDDSASATMNNSEDTEVGINGEQAKLNVLLSFVQVAS